MSSYLEIIEFLLIGAPNGIVKTVVLANHADSLVCVIDIYIGLVSSFKALVATVAVYTFGNALT